MSKEKVVLAYSGGLDTTAIIPWLKETYDYDVVCCCVDCGQGEELDGLEERALYSGASKLYIEDITDDFCENYIMPCVQAVRSSMSEDCVKPERANLQWRIISHVPARVLTECLRNYLLM